MELKSAAESFKEALIQAREKAVENNNATACAKADKKLKVKGLSLDLTAEKRSDEMETDGEKENISDEDAAIPPKITGKNKLQHIKGCKKLPSKDDGSKSESEGENEEIARPSNARRGSLLKKRVLSKRNRVITNRVPDSDSE